jgi:hypothetical protein
MREGLVRSISRLVVVLAVVCGVPFGSGSAVAGQTALSAGCTYLNDPVLDDAYSSAASPALQFFSGETITVTAGAPFTGTPTGAFLQVPALTTVDSATTLPATLSYQFPADTVTSVGIFVEPVQASTATWDVSCAAGVYELAPPIQNLALSRSVISFRLPTSATVRFSLDKRVTRTRFRRVGKFSTTARRGRNRVRVPRRLGGRRVGKGVFRLSARASGGGPLSRRLVRIR